MIAKLCCVQIFSGRSRSPKLVFAASGDSINPPAIVRLAAPPRGSRSSGTKRGTHRMWRRGGRSAPSETADRTTCGRKQRPHMGVCVVPPPELEPGTQGLPLACPGAALMCLFCPVQQQFWRPPGSAEDRPITVESWSLPMNKR